MDSNIPPHVGHHHHHRPPATTSFSSSLGSELDTTGGGPATPSPATLFAAPLVPPLLHDSSPFSPPTGLGDGDGGTAPSSASSSSSSESPGGGGHQNLPPPSSTSTMQTAARGLGMMGMSGGYADSLKILFSKPSGHEEVLSEDEARRRREQLNRRPSYRMILKDLETVDKTMKTEPEDSPPDASSLGSTVDTTPGTSTNNLNGPGDSLHVQIPRSGLLPSTSSAPQQQLQQNSNGAMGSSPYNSPLSNNLLLGQGPLHPMPLNGGDISLGDYNTQLSLITAASLANVARTSQITPTSAFEGSTGDMHTLKGMQDHSFSQGVDWTSSLMSSTGYDSSPSPTGGHGGGMGGEDEGTRKRQVRLLKNREAAKECRRKKKEYVKCLENRVAVLENQNKALIEELKALKELYCRKEKSDM